MLYVREPFVLDRDSSICFISVCNNRLYGESCIEKFCYSVVKSTYCRHRITQCNSENIPFDWIFYGNIELINHKLSYSLDSYYPHRETIRLRNL